MIPLLFFGCASQLRSIPDGLAVDMPVDDAPHRWAQTEWWHLHADLLDIRTREPVHVFAAFLVERTDQDHVAGIPASLAINPFHVAYVRVQTEGHSFVADRENFPDFFAANFLRRGVGIRHGDWEVRWEHDAYALEADAGPSAFELRFTPTGPTTLPGEDGRVELREGAGSLWVQMDQMHVEGRWQDGRQTRWVEGSGFYKHQWGRLYDPGFDGFQWITVDLPEQQTLSVAWLKEDGITGVAGSRAWLSSRFGTFAVPSEELRVTPEAWWTSARSGARWPTAFSIQGPDLDLHVRATQSDGELWVFPAPIWEGPATAEGQVGEETLTAPAFIEQAGETHPFFRFLLHSSAPRSSL
jgi:predicted secreted hydrolase